MADAAVAFPLDTDDLIEEEEARRVTRCRSDRTWESWHERQLLSWYVPPGTNKRLYSCAQLLEWIRSGARGTARPPSVSSRRGRGEGAR